MSYRVITGNRKNFRTGRSSFHFRGTVLVLLTIDDHIHPYFRVSVFYLLATLLSGEICCVNKPFVVSFTRCCLRKCFMPCL